MSYVNKNLMDGEQVVYRTHRHWIILIRPLIFVVLGLALAIWGLVREKQDGQGWVGISGILLAAGAVIFLVGLWIGLPRLVDYSTAEFAVTNRRVIVKVGWIQRRSIETLLSKIEAIEVNQGVGGRLSNYGTITVIGTGGTHEPFDLIARPLEFRRKVQEQIIAMQQAR